MATIPDATVTISPTAGAQSGGTGYVVVIAPVGTNADSTPRVYSSYAGILSQHGYSPGADYAATHIDETKKPVIFVGIPIATAGTIGRQDASGVLGNSVISVAAGAAGPLEEVEAVVTVDRAGTIGTTGIRLLLSLDGGTTEKPINLGTATSYVIPYVGLTLSFAAGTLLAGDVFSFSTTAPMWDSDGISGARAALSAQQNLSRSWMPIGDAPTDTVAGYVVTAVNAYKTNKKRFTGARVQIRDRTPLASMSRVTVRMSGSPTLTFLEVGSGSDTITRSAGSFVADGFAIGDVITVAGSVSNNVTAKVTGVSALFLTLGAAVADDLANEGPVSNCTIVGSNSLVFATTTCTRSGGSWLSDGFAVGDSVTFAGTSTNNITVTITVLTATVMTFASGGSAETIGSRSVTATKGETMAAFVSAMATEFATIDAEPRINLGLGRLRHASPIHGWQLRRPVQWAASVRSYQHDVHHTTWNKEDGPLKGWTNTDEHNNVVEYDEDTDGGALAARFTCARTWGNGPIGAFIAKDVTRDTEGSELALQHNLDVANVFCTVVQAKTENFTGQTLVIKADGTAEAASLQVLEESVNSAIKQALIREFVPGEGIRASLARWTASTDDDLRGDDATLTGVGKLVVNGTIVHVNTSVAVS